MRKSKSHIRFITLLLAALMLPSLSAVLAGYADSGNKKGRNRCGDIRSNHCIRRGDSGGDRDNVPL